MSKSEDPNVEKIVESLRYRSSLGKVKYGTDTTRDDIDLIGWLRHLQEELLDASVYIERSIDDLITRKANV